jgi:hypothetical protein
MLSTRKEGSKRVGCAKKNIRLQGVHRSGPIATNTPSAAHPSLANFLYSLTNRTNEPTLLSTTPITGADRFPGASSVLEAANRYRWSCTTRRALRICTSNSPNSLSKLSTRVAEFEIGKEASFHSAVPARFRMFSTAVICSTRERL